MPDPDLIFPVGRGDAPAEHGDRRPDRGQPFRQPRGPAGAGRDADIVLVEGTVEATPAGEIPTDVGDAFAAKAGFDPRAARGSYHYFRVRPRAIQAWREVNELAGRDLMRDGRWL